MSLVSRITALATRIAQEFNSVRSEIAALPAGNFETGVSFPSNPSVGQTFFMSDTQVAYIFGGEQWIAMTPVLLIDGGDAELSSADVVDGGDA